MIKQKKVSKSVFFRLFLTLFLVLIPINVILIIYALFMFNNVKEQTYSERENVLSMYVASLDAAVEQMTTSFYRLASEYDMLLLMQSDAQHSSDNIEWHSARTRLMNTYRQWLQDYPLIDGIFSYYDYGDSGENSWAVRSTSPNVIPDINNRMMDLLEKEIVIANKNGDIYRGCPWQPLYLDQQNFLIRIWKSNNCYYGCWINLDSVIGRWDLNKEGSPELFFLDSDGNIRSGDSKDLTGENIISVDSQTTGLKLVTSISDQIFLYSVPKIVILFVVFAFIALAAIPVLALVTRKYILKPVNELLKAMDKVRLGDLNYQIPHSGISGEFAILDESFNVMIRQLRDTKIAAYESEMERQRIWMRYLSQQIQPHFVLNTLNILYSYEPEEYRLIQKMILCLSKYFRYIVKVHSDFVELRQELDHIKNYFQIQLARYPDRFYYYVEAQEGMDHLLIPPLIIQNFTENSIKYSISMQKKISIYVLVEFFEEDKMRIRIADTGNGLSSEVLDAIERFRRTRKYQEELGVGIQNAIERLDILYHGIPKIQFYNSTSGGATIDIIMPCRVKEGMEELNDENSDDC